MKHLHRHALPLAACALLALAAAAPARADLSPVGTAITGTALGSPIPITQITIAPSVTVTCVRSTITARITAARQISGAFDAVQTCPARAFGSNINATVSFSGQFTMQVTSSYTGLWMKARFGMDTGSALTVDLPAVGCRYTVPAPQQTTAWDVVTFQQSTQVMTLAVTLFANGSGGPCGTTTTWSTITGPFAISPRVTVL